MIVTAYSLDELCFITDGSHFSPEGIESGYPMFAVKDMGEYGFDYSSCKRISKEDFQLMKKSGCVPKMGDVLVAKDGSYLKEIFVQTEDKEEAILSSIAIFRPNTKLILPDYLCYLLKSPSVLNYIKDNCVSGSAIPRIVLKSFKNIKLNIPSLEIQIKTVSYLKVIDDKIRLIRKINDNLEQQAIAQYHKIFDEIEPTLSLNEVTFNLETGKRPSGGIDPSCTDIPSIGAENVKSLGHYDYSKTKFVSSEYFDCMKKGKSNDKKIRLYIYKDGGTPGNYIPHFSLFGKGYPYNVFSINEHVFQIDFGNEGLNSYAYFFFNTDEVRYELEVRGGKAAIPGIGQSAITELKIHDFNSEEVKTFSEYAHQIVNTILSNCVESVRLMQLRDYLLPKLMSGEIDVSTLEIPN